MSIEQQLLDYWQARFNVLTDAWRTGDNDTVLRATHEFIKANDSAPALVKLKTIAELQAELASKDLALYAKDVSIDGLGKLVDELRDDNKRLSREAAHQTDMADQANIACMRAVAERDQLKSCERELATLKGLAAEFDAADDDADWQPPHPIFNMAADIDRLNAQVLALQSCEVVMREALTRIAAQREHAMDAAHRGVITTVACDITGIAVDALAKCQPQPLPEKQCQHDLCEPDPTLKLIEGQCDYTVIECTVCHQRWNNPVKVVDESAEKLPEKQS